jgi:hypothetical protein
LSTSTIEDIVDDNRAVLFPRLSSAYSRFTFPTISAGRHSQSFSIDCSEGDHAFMVNGKAGREEVEEQREAAAQPALA